MTVNQNLADLVSIGITTKNRWQNLEITLAKIQEVGSLVSPDNPEELNQALTIALEKIANSSIDGEKIRARYFSGFDMQSAHQTWTSVID